MRKWASRHAWELETPGTPGRRGWEWLVWWRSCMYQDPCVSCFPELRNKKASLGHSVITHKCGQRVLCVYTRQAECGKAGLWWGLDSSYTCDKVWTCTRVCTNIRSFGWFGNYNPYMRRRSRWARRKRKVQCLFLLPAQDELIISDHVEHWMAIKKKAKFILGFMH